MPQGTILGPILFLIYVNDFSYCFTDSKCVIYADDTTIFFSSDKPNVLQQTIQNGLSKASKLLDTNRLVVNTSKSDFIVIGNISRVKDCDVSVNINGDLIKSSQSTKLLGVHIDSQLSFKNHIQSLLTKLAPKLGLLRRLSFDLPEYILLTIYKSVIQPHIDYCLSVWGSCNKTDMLSVQKVQNRAARSITRCFDQNVTSESIIKRQGLMTVSERYKYFTSVLVYKGINNLLNI